MPGSISSGLRHGPAERALGYLLAVLERHAGAGRARPGSVDRRPGNVCGALTSLSWRLPPAPGREAAVSDLIEESLEGVTWFTAAERAGLLNLMSPLNLAKVEAAKNAGRRSVETV